MLLTPTVVAVVAVETHMTVAVVTMVGALAAVPEITLEARLITA